MPKRIPSTTSLSSSSSFEGDDDSNALFGSLIDDDILTSMDMKEVINILRTNSHAYLDYEKYLFIMNQACFDLRMMFNVHFFDHQNTAMVTELCLNPFRGNLVPNGDPINLQTTEFGQSVYDARISSISDRNEVCVWVDTFFFYDQARKKFIWEDKRWMTVVFWVMFRLYVVAKNKNRLNECFSVMVGDAVPVLRPVESRRSTLSQQRSSSIKNSFRAQKSRSNISLPVVYCNDVSGGILGDRLPKCRYYDLTSQDDDINIALGVIIAIESDLVSDGKMGFVGISKRRRNEIKDACDLYILLRETSRDSTSSNNSVFGYLLLSKKPGYEYAVERLVVFKSDVSDVYASLLLDSCLPRVGQAPRDISTLTLRIHSQTNEAFEWVPPRSFNFSSREGKSGLVYVWTHPTTPLLLPENGEGDAEARQCPCTIS